MIEIETTLRRDLITRKLPTTCNRKAFDNDEGPVTKKDDNYNYQNTCNVININNI